MNIQSNYFNVTIFFIIFITLISAGYADGFSYLKSEEQTSVDRDFLNKRDGDTTFMLSDEEINAQMEIEYVCEDIVPITIEELNEIESLKGFDEKEHSNYSESAGDDPLSVNNVPSGKSDQELLDSALGFCQVSNDFWEQGDLDSALDALDQAYSLILQVNSHQEPEILQQRDDLRFTISKRIIECYSSRFTVANGNHKEIPLVMNEHVEKALIQFTGKQKDFFIESYRRSGRYRPAIVKALKEAGLPEELSWLPLIESGFKVKALSRARALGPWQFIASTGYKFGLKRDQWVDERMDPEKSTKAAIAYLKELHQIFGDWTTVLAAYNCGEWAVLKRIRTQRINYLDNFWDLYMELPRETAFYVPKFLAVLHILNDPEMYNFTLPPVEKEMKPEKVTIEKQVHLKTVARHLDVSFKALKDLNPSLKYDFTPSKSFELKVPQDKGSVLLSKLDDIPRYHPPIPSYVVHRVRTGESLSVIARRYRTSVRKIMAFNGLRSRHFIRAGWKLKIPTRKTYIPSKRISTQVLGSIDKKETIRHVVRRGDSLWKIANRFGTTTKAILSLNQLKSTRLRIGQILLVPKGQSISVDIKTKTYEVIEGDSSYAIAKKHHMSLSEFFKLNHLTPRSTIFPGQILLVRAE
ncbi:MAG: LysM peptidoglycan-binding domain-containing protein [Thermodesulfobacteriota bacterium]|nr:LysM peptidoglycan-binding domain-containing protein [Thermodesulfobacteriota bacterium]